MSKIKKLIGSRSGQSLVGVLIAGGLGAIVLGFITDMMIQQGIGQKYLTQKLEINDLTSSLITTFSRANNCTCQFADNIAVNPNFSNFGVLNFNSTITDGTQRIPVNKIYSGCLGGTNLPFIIAEDGVKVTNSTNLTVDKVEFVNLRPTGGPNEWQGQWQVSFQTGSAALVRSVKPILITQKVTINTSPPYSAAAAVISGCSGVSTGTGTANFIAKWSGILGVLQDSGIFEDVPTGSVGIGTSTPLAKLEISNGTGLVISNSATFSQLGFANLNNTGGYADSTAADKRTAVIDTARVIGANAGQEGGSLKFYTKPADVGGLIPSRMTIDSTGNVGIGTTSPQRKLHIQSAADTGIRIDSPATFQNFLEFSKSGAQAGFIGMAINTGLFTGINNGDMAVRSQNTPLHLGTQATPAITVLTNNNVGIGTTNPAYTLDVNGNARATGSVAAWSDLRAKKNIRPLENSLDKLSQINGVEFDWRLQEFPDKKFKTTRDIGVIAQEVEKVFPEIVETAPDGYKSVAYSLFVAPIIEAIKELKKLVQDLFISSHEQSKDIAFLKADYAQLKIENENMEKENIELKARLDQQEKELAAIKNKLGL